MQNVGETKEDQTYNFDFFHDVSKGVACFQSSDTFPEIQCHKQLSYEWEY